MAAKSAEQLSARERLLAAANELFYEEGVNTVGIDRVIERAGVAKATLYSAFGSKDELIRAYLEQRYQARRERTMRALEKYESPRERLMAVFDTLADSLSQPNYQAGAADPQQLAWQLHLLYDGASVSARMDHDPGAASPARQAAEALISAALG
jgi:AcrR family transcriptional regulator